MILRILATLFTDTFWPSYFTYDEAAWSTGEELQWF